MVVPSSKNIEDFCEGGDEGCISSGRHWADDDGVEVIDVHNKDVLHIFEGPDRESTSEVCVHGTGCGIGKRAAKQNISWTAQALWVGNIRSTLAWARITSACLLLVAC